MYTERNTNNFIKWRNECYDLRRTQKAVVNAFILNRAEYFRCQEEMKEHLKKEREAEKKFLLSIGFIKDEEDSVVEEISDIEDDDVFDEINKAFSETEEAINLSKEYKRIIDKQGEIEMTFVILSPFILDTNNKDIFDIIDMAKSSLVYREKFVETLIKLDVTSLTI